LLLGNLWLPGVCGHRVGEGCRRLYLEGWEGGGRRLCAKVGHGHRVLVGKLREVDKGLLQLQQQLLLLLLQLLLLLILLQRHILLLLLLLILLQRLIRFLLLLLLGLLIKVPLQLWLGSCGYGCC
jgi:hypothetical protein